MHRFGGQEQVRKAAMADDDPAAATSVNVPSTTRARSCVLVAEANADLREYIGRLLSRDHDVRLIGDGAAALAVALEDLPDLVLAGLRMPGLDGVDLMRHLRSNAATASIPIVLVSSDAA